MYCIHILTGFNILLACLSKIQGVKTLLCNQTWDFCLADNKTQFLEIS